MKIYILIIVAFISFIVYGVFNQNRIDPKVKRVACQNSVTTFEKIYSTDLKFAKELLLSSNYIIESKIEYSKSMKSNLYNIFSNKQSDQILNDVLSKFKNSDKKYDKKLLISYYIYENDKEDKGKKNKDAKSYAGYLVFEFKYDKKLVYKIQTDYMNLDAKDIDERMDCVVNSFISIN